ncbi:hypothetical protein SAGO17_0079 [Mimivirus AB-566-O17]|uniref:histidine kinase n=1 Tax=Mimivirus AB-566-O17 TaxID=1988039 RepID=A0A1X9VNV7_9VIRU|nr:hypothetical protein SAGO17_0079 [Mimivirus AB-566-O17]
MNEGDFMESLFDEIPSGILRKDNGGKVVFMNAFLAGMDVDLEEYLRNKNLIESKVEKGIFFVNDYIPTSSILDNIDVGVYKKVNDYVVYTNKFLLNMMSSGNIHDIESLMTSVSIDDNDYTSLRTEEKTYMMSTRVVDNYNLLHDKTHVVELQRHLHNINYALRHQENEKERFVMNISHDIRTPLSSIIGLLSLMSSSNTVQQQQQYIKMMQESSFKLLETINDILDYTKLEIGNIVLKKDIMSTRVLIEDITVIVKEMLIPLDIKFNTFVSIDVPDFFMMDCKRLKQVILSIVSHSLLYTESGSIQISIMSISEERYKSFMECIPICKKCNNYVCLICKNNQECYCADTKCLCCKKDNSIKNLYLQFEITDTGEMIEESKRAVMFTNQ